MMFRALYICWLMFMVGCGSTPSGSDAGAPDSGPIDGGESSADAGAIDAGIDSGIVDAGAADAGTLDAGQFSSPDAGIDAGETDGGMSTADAGADSDGGMTDGGDFDGGTADDAGTDGGIDAGPECDVSTPCLGALTCCGFRCVDLDLDPAHCGQCDLSCGSDAFCGRGMCRPTDFSQLCHLPVATAVLDGLAEDDDAGVQLADAIVAACSPMMALQYGIQGPPALSAGGEPVALGQLLLMSGGSFGQRGIAWLETNNLALVRDTSSTTNAILSLQDGGVISDVPMASLHTALDRAVIQIVRAPSGAVVLNVSGFHGPGTAAAVRYFVDQILPMRASLTTRWYVIEWEDINANGGPDAADRYTLLASGP